MPIGTSSVDWDAIASNLGRIHYQEDTAPGNDKCTTNAAKSRFRRLKIKMEKLAVKKGAAGKGFAVKAAAASSGPTKGSRVTKTAGTKKSAGVSKNTITTKKTTSRVSKVAKEGDNEEDDDDDDDEEEEEPREYVPTFRVDAMKKAMEATKAAKKA